MTTPAPRIAVPASAPDAAPEATAPPAELLDRARELAARGERRILGIAGPPGAGKSTLAARVAAALGPATAVLVPMDGFHLADTELARLDRTHRKGAPDTFDAAGYTALLARLRDQHPDETVYAPSFDRTLDQPIAGALPVHPETPLVITEGNYLLLDDPAWRPVRTLLDTTWYVEVDNTRRLERLTARHVHHGKSPEAAEAWVQRSDEANAKLVAATKEKADLIVTLTD